MVPSYLLTGLTILGVSQVIQALCPQDDPPYATMVAPFFNDFNDTSAIQCAQTDSGPGWSVPGLCRELLADIQMYEAPTWLDWNKCDYGGTDPKKTRRRLNQDQFITKVNDCTVAMNAVNAASPVKVAREAVQKFVEAGVAKCFQTKDKKAVWTLFEGATISLYPAKTG